MHRFLKTLLFFLTVLAFVSSSPAGAAPSENRLALVIGNASYKAKPLATAVNDAALIAQTLEAAGFDVVAARDLNEDSLRKAFSDFIDRAKKAGPDAVALVYFAGYGLQLEGENYLLPIAADIADASDVPARALRLSEQTHALAALHLKTSFVILDAARASPFVLPGLHLAGGLALAEPEANMLIAFNAAPGTVSPDDGSGYGPYARALAEMIRQGGLTPANLFDRVRLRVNELTKGAQVPWDTSEIDTQFVFFERTPDAPPRADSPQHTAVMRSQTMRSLGARNAYMVALMRDTFDAYADFLADYWHDPMTKRVRAIVAARREAITWRRTCQANVPDAYWSYLERYPRGPHVADAGRLLTHLGAAVAPPAKFAMMAYDMPQPLPDERDYIERPVLVFDDPAFGFDPLQPSPVSFLEPPPSEFSALAAPAASRTRILPAPKFVSLPADVRVPAGGTAPPNPPVADNAQQAPVTKATNDAPSKPAGQAVSSSMSPSKANNGGDDRGLVSRGETTAALGDIRSVPPARHPELRGGIEVPQSSRVAETPLRPFWAAYDPLAWKGIKVPPIASPPVTSLMPRWASYDPAVREEIREPGSSSTLGWIRRPATVAPQATGPTLRRPRGAAMLSPQTTGSIPPPLRRRITSPSQPVGNQPKPIAAVASSSPSIKVDQAGQPTAAQISEPASSRRLARAPNIAPRVSPSKPRRKPCPVVDGTKICG
jgi:uncharacterized caspase-like protein